MKHGNRTKKDEYMHDCTTYILGKSSREKKLILSPQKVKIFSSSQL